MKKLFIPLTILFLALIFTACTKDSPNCDCVASLPDKLETVKIESSMKGWELYSWQENAKGCRKWKYALLQGTNKLKTYNEVTVDAFMKVSGEQQLKLLLNKFPANESIIWVGENWLSKVWGQSNINYGNLRLPSTTVLDEIKQHCVQTGLQLSITP